MKAVIFANGVINPDKRLISDLKPGDLVIAADGGTRNALISGLHPHVVIGDQYSISDYDKENLSTLGTQFLTHPQDKDQTDLELALDYAVHSGAEEVMLIGLLGGRLDQTLANLLLLTKDAYSSMKLVVSASPDMAYVLREQSVITIEAQTGDIVSLIPLSPVVSGVTTHNLHWPLNAAELEFGSTLGISNEMEAPVVSIQIDTGKLLVIHRRNENSYL